MCVVKKGGRIFGFIVRAEGVATNPAKVAAVSYFTPRVYFIPRVSMRGCTPNMGGTISAPDPP